MEVRTIRRIASNGAIKFGGVCATQNVGKRVFIRLARLYRQLYVVLEDGIEGYFTDTNDRGCAAENLSMKREKRKELERVGHIVIKRYK